MSSANDKAKLVSEAERVLQSAMEAAPTSRRRRSLGTLGQVLRERLERGETTFDIGVVSAESAAAGGPAKQTIMNKPGADYREVIAAFARVVGPQNAKSAQPVNYEDDFALRLATGISDHHIRAEVLMMVSERRALQKQLTMLRAQVAAGMIIKLDGRRPEQLQGPKLTETEIGAIRAFTSCENLEQFEWQVAPDGRLLTLSGIEVARYGFLSALEKILSAN